MAFSIIGTAISAYSAYNQYSAGRDAKAAGQKQLQIAAQSAAEQRSQFEAQQRIADIKNQRERATIARQGRIARGAIENTGANTNTSGSTGVIGGAASIDTQTSSNLNIFDQIAGNQSDIIASQERQGGLALQSGQAQASQVQAQSDISQNQAIFKLGSSIFDAAGGFKTIFDTTNGNRKT